MKLILFDLDGTLIKSTGIILESFKMSFDKYFPDVKLSEEKLTSFLGTTLWQTFGEYTKDDDMITEIIGYYRHVSEAMLEKDLVAYPNAHETIQFLKDHGCQVGVVTSKLNHVASHHLAITKLLPLIDGLIGYDDVKTHKPDPEPLLKALALFDVEANEAIYIGDHENDIKAAKKAGMLSCAVTYSYRLKQMLNEFPDYVIDDISHIKDLVA